MIKENEKHIGTVIKELLYNKGFTQIALCEQVDINKKSFCYKLKTGSFTFEEVLKLMEVFNLELEDMKKLIDYKSVELKNRKQINF